jgi:hypothetical protein
VDLKGLEGENGVKIKLKYLIKKNFAAVSTFSGACNGNRTIFFRSKEAYCANYGTPMISLSVKIHRLQKEV